MKLLRNVWKWVITTSFMCPVKKILVWIWWIFLVLTAWSRERETRWRSRSREAVQSQGKHDQGRFSWVDPGHRRSTFEARNSGFSRSPEGCTKSCFVRHPKEINQHSYCGECWSPVAHICCTLVQLQEVTCHLKAVISFLNLCWSCSFAQQKIIAFIDSSWVVMAC